MSEPHTWGSRQADIGTSLYRQPFPRWRGPGRVIIPWGQRSYRSNGIGYKGIVMNELYAILVPKFYGPMPGEYLVDTPIPGEELQAFQVLCVERTGGLTIAPDCKGIWVDPNDATGKTYLEPMTPYLVMTDSATVRELALKVKELYQQKAVMFYRVSDLCQIV